MNKTIFYLSPKKLITIITIMVVMLMVSSSVFAAAIDDPTDTWNVTPIERNFPGDRSCPSGSTLFEDLFGTLPQNTAGVYSYTEEIDGVSVTIEITVYADNSFDFDITNGVTSQVFVKGGQGSAYLLYQYDPEVLGATNDGPVSNDTGLHAGVNAQDQYQAISHLDFCIIPYVPLTVEKTAEGEYDRTVTWELVKTVDPASHTGIFGDDAGTSTWTVVATKTETFGNYVVSGTITIFNTNDIVVTALISDLVGGTIPAVVDCDGNVSGLVDVPANGQLDCTYTVSLDYTGEPDGDEVPTYNVVNVTSQTEGVGGDSDQADIVYTENVIGDDEVTVDDDRDTEGQFPTDISETTTFDYDETFECSSDQGDYTDGVAEDSVTNTATLTGPNTDLEDDASVTVTCYAPTVSKDAIPSWEEFYDWDIEKNVDETEFVGNVGDDWVFNYDIDVLLITYDSLNFAVEGTITVTNPAPAGSGLSMTVDVSDAVGGVDAIVDCDLLTDGNQTSLTVAAGDSAECSYSLDMGDDLDALLAFEYTNVATAALGGGSFTGQATFQFDSVDPVLAEDSEPAEVTATDDNATDDTGDDRDSDTITETTQDVIEYSQDGECPTDITEYENGVYTLELTNTAVINETGDDDSETVTVTCYAPLVSKDATATFTRDWDWTIDKVGPEGPIILEEPQSYMAEYDVTLSATYEDTNTVTGTIYVTNPGDADMTVVLSDALNDAAATEGVISDCVNGTWDAVAETVTVAPDATAECSYTASPADRSSTKNTVTYSINGATDTAEAPYTWAKAGETDECADVTDDLFGLLGEICVSADDDGGNVTYSGTPAADVTFNADATGGTFSYALDLHTLTIVNEALCGEEVLVENTAEFVTNDTPDTDDDTHEVLVTKPCEGCTLTQGYWKTHSSYGPAPYDETWAEIGEDTPFFSSGQSYYEVLWTAPQGGNAYYILAHQYIAAELNMANDASTTTEVDEAFAEATLLFQTYSDDDFAALRGRTATNVRRQFLELAGILADYNEGDIGPGHCSEDNLSAPN